MTILDEIRGNAKSDLPADEAEEILASLDRAEKLFSEVSEEDAVGAITALSALLGTDVPPVTEDTPAREMLALAALVNPKLVAEALIIQSLSVTLGLPVSLLAVMGPEVVAEFLTSDFDED